MLRGRRILLAVTGSIAAYKSAFLLREFIKAGAEVKVYMSSGARRFISPITFNTLSGSSVLSEDEALDTESGEWTDHIYWGRWPDAILVAPATADTIARLGQGRADDLLGLIYLSAECPVQFAPAMDLEMHRHPAVQNNIRVLQEQGAKLIPAQEGELASGLKGHGRMEEPEAIIHSMDEFLSQDKSLKGKKILITAGPTYEAIDPVRFIGNRSSGKMGVALAEVAAQRGAEVVLVLGPAELRPADPSVHVIDVMSSREMYQAATERFPGCDLAVMAAAVADYRPAEVHHDKVKKEEGLSEIPLEPTEDILKALGEDKKRGQFLVGFALESGEGSHEGPGKLERKKADMIVLNSLEDEGAGFEADTNTVTLYTPDNDPEQIPLKLKSEVAERIFDRIQACIA